MRKLVALAVVVILSSNVMASEGGINEETDLSNTDLESMQYSNIVYAEEEFSISMSLKNETTNISQINWITQVCINSGICYPPKTIQMSTEDNITWTASVLVDEDATYLNWRVDLVDENDTIVKVPETGFGWKKFGLIAGMMEKNGEEVILPVLPKKKVTAFLDLLYL